MSRRMSLISSFARKSVIAGVAIFSPSIARPDAASATACSMTTPASRTFSAAEEFSYNLKNLKRATIIGEITGGGAHPGGTVRLNEHFGVFLPIGRAINPISKTNWEGTGVEPDIKAPKEHALKIAYLMALKKSFDSIKDENVKGGVKQLIEQTQKELDDLKKSARAN